MREAILYDKLEKKWIRCRLCQHRCFIGDGKRGLCGCRVNKNGQLFTTNYGRAIAAHVDPMEKKPLYHFLPGTKIYSLAAPGCNFRCRFCQNSEISQIAQNINVGNLERVTVDLPPAAIVQAALKERCPAIAYTYTEPTVFFEYALATAKIAKEAGLKNVFVTNGYQTEEAITKMAGVIDAVNVDLKSFSEDFYQRICGAKLKPILNNIKLFHEKGIWVEVTTLIIPENNDSAAELKKIAGFLANISPDLPWHLSRFHGDYKMANLKETPLETLETAYRIGRAAGLNYVYIGNVPDSKYQDTYCPKCQARVIKRKFYDVEINLNVNRCPACSADLPIIVG